MCNKTKPKSVFTTSYQYGDHNEEYVFACKGRPFAALISNILPTPDTNLIDHNLVRELGLKMTNLQCRKFHYAGHKMRVLGRVSTAVQCIQDGRTNGGIHLKGLVVTNLDQFLDTQVIVGAKMRGNIKKMSGKNFNERKCSTGDSSDDVCSDSDADDSVVSTQVLEDSLLAPDSTTAMVHSVLEDVLAHGELLHEVLSERMSTPTVNSSMMASYPQPNHKMSSTVVSPPTVTSATMSSYGLPSSSIPTSTATTSVITAWVYPYLPGNPSRWYDKAEYRGKIIQQSVRDGKPRITNTFNGVSSNMARVGNWDHLDDPLDHEARHAVLANLRKADPDRVCQLCSYLLRHKCVLTDDYGVLQHCKDCCNMANQLHLKQAAEKYKEALQQM